MSVKFYCKCSLEQNNKNEELSLATSKLLREESSSGSHAVSRTRETSRLAYSLVTLHAHLKHLSKNAASCLEKIKDSLAKRRFTSKLQYIVFTSAADTDG